MKLEHLKYYVAESSKEFTGWEYMGKRKHKRGVWVVDIRKILPSGMGEFRSVYCRTKHLPKTMKVCI